MGNVCSNSTKTGTPPRPPKGILLAVGMPMMDMLAVVEPSFLEKYQLRSNEIMMGTDDLLPMLFDLEKNYRTEYVAGGADQNSFRVAQWILRKPKVTIFMGATGTGKMAERLEKIMKGDGVDVRYQKWEEYHTGMCVVLITGRDRTLCAYRSASNYFSMKYLERPENFCLVENARFYYLTGFFLTVSPESMELIGRHAVEKNKMFSLNLSAPYICRGYLEPLLSVMPYVDILFGNKNEAEAFSEAEHFETTDVIEIAKRIVAYPKASSRPRMVIITHGANDILVMNGEEPLREYPVTAVPQEKIIDTNGAGDAFVGGFLAQYIQGRDLDECVRCGIWAACEVIQMPGCSFPKSKKYN